MTRRKPLRFKTPEEYSAWRNANLAKIGGLWNDPTCPHEGWQCTDDFRGHEGTGTYATCDMCFVKKGRKVIHICVMEHPDYKTLEVGMNCAQHMEYGYQGPSPSRGLIHTEVAYKRELDARHAAGYTIVTGEHAGLAWQLRAYRPLKRSDWYVKLRVPDFPDWYYPDRPFDSRTEATQHAKDMAARVPDIIDERLTERARKEAKCAEEKRQREERREAARKAKVAEERRRATSQAARAAADRAQRQHQEPELADRQRQEAEERAVVAGWIRDAKQREAAEKLAKSQRPRAAPKPRQPFDAAREKAEARARDPLGAFMADRRAAHGGEI
jgi:hypothetical protein